MLSLHVYLSILINRSFLICNRYLFHSLPDIIDLTKSYKINVMKFVINL